MKVRKLNGTSVYCTVGHALVSYPGSLPNRYPGSLPNRYMETLQATTWMDMVQLNLGRVGLVGLRHNAELVGIINYASLTYM